MTASTEVEVDPQCSRYMGNFITELALSSLPMGNHLSMPSYISWILARH